MLAYYCLTFLSSFPITQTEMTPIVVFQNRKETESGQDVAVLLT